MEDGYYSEEELAVLGFKSIGKNVQISNKASIYGASKMSLGDNIRIDDFAILKGKITIGNNVHISAFCILAAGEAGIILEDFSGLSTSVTIHAQTDDYSGGFLTNPTIPEEYTNVSGGTVVIKKHVIVGAQSVILPNLTIGIGSSVGSMSLVNKDLDEWGVYIGIPCKRIKERSKDLLLLEKDYLSRK